MLDYTMWAPQMQQKTEITSTKWLTRGNKGVIMYVSTMWTITDKEDG